MNSSIQGQTIVQRSLKERHYRTPQPAKSNADLEPSFEEVTAPNVGRALGSRPSWVVRDLAELSRVDRSWHPGIDVRGSSRRLAHMLVIVLFPRASNLGPGGYGTYRLQ